MTTTHRKTQGAPASALDLLDATDPVAIIAASATTRIRALLADGVERSREEIARVLPDIEPHTISKTLYHLRRRGELEGDTFDAKGQLRSRLRHRAVPSGEGAGLPVPSAPKSPPRTPSGDAPTVPTATATAIEPAPAAIEPAPAPRSAPHRAEAALLHGIHPGGWSLKQITRVGECHDRLAELVLDAVIEGHGGHAATERIAQAAERLSDAIKEMRGHHLFCAERLNQRKEGVA